MATATESRSKGRDTMSVFNHTTRTRAVARALFPALPATASPIRHGCDITTKKADAGAPGRLRYRSPPFYLKIQGLEGPRQPHFV